MDIANLRQWIGRTQAVADVAAPGPVERLAALLDHKFPPWRDGEIPPLGHWLYFLPHARQADIDVDGHPRRGDFLPAVALPRRMWAGSRISFHRPIVPGAEMTRRSTVTEIAEKHGASGDMVFVTVRHEVAIGGIPALTEEQDIVFRAAPKNPPASKAERGVEESSRPPAHTRRVTPDPTLLFRFSALTFNAHRIHYDRNYCKQVEGYPGLVVQGPLTAMLLMDHFLRVNPRTSPTTFEFRARRPLFDGAPIDLCLGASPGSVELWARDADGQTAMTARVLATI